MHKIKFKSPPGKIPLPWQVNFWKHIKFTDDDQNGCWQWTGGLNREGYGHFWLDGRCRNAHQVAILFSGKKLIKGLVVDHLCKNRGCVNPRHLRQCTHYQNIIENGEGRGAKNKRKTHCLRGHPFDRVNTLYFVTRAGNVGRLCRRCTRLRQMGKI